MNCSEFSNLLDLYLDGELDEAQRAALKDHAAVCEECRATLTAAEQLREILSQMDDGLEMPLPAQAAWRGAVREEAKRRRMKRLYSVCGAVAAVCVLTLGVTAMLHSGVRGGVPGTNAVVETDGLSEDADLAGEEVLGSLRSADQIAYADRTIHVENTEEARGYLMDIVAEYGGTVTQEAEESNATKVYVQIPGENAEDFVSAVDGLGIEPEDGEISLDPEAECVGVCVTITEN